jgi:hypothetical protein
VEKAAFPVSLTAIEKMPFSIPVACALTVKRWILASKSILLLSPMMSGYFA